MQRPSGREISCNLCLGFNHFGDLGITMFVEVEEPFDPRLVYIFFMLMPPRRLWSHSILERMLELAAAWCR
jgi:hypothetical protein